MIERPKTTTELSNEPPNKLLCEPPLGYLRKEIYCCISEGVSDMRLDNLPSRAGTIDIAKIP